jgi:hypothetical protein
MKVSHLLRVPQGKPWQREWTHSNPFQFEYLGNGVYLVHYVIPGRNEGHEIGRVYATHRVAAIGKFMVLDCQERYDTLAEAAHALLANHNAPKVPLEGIPVRVHVGQSSRLPNMDEQEQGYILPGRRPRRQTEVRA